MRVGKIIPVAVATLLLGCLLVWAIRKEAIPKEALTFEINGVSSTMHVNAWLDTTNLCYYLFLPSYANIDDVTYASKQLPLVVEDKVIDYGNRLPALEPNKEYKLVLKNSKKERKLSIIKSANVATMFIDIDESILIHVNKNKDVKASSSMTLLSPNGKVLYDKSRGNVKLKGRGDSTWGLDKKSYSLILDKPDSLLGMAPATNWVLLANGFDESNLKNKIIYDFARWLNYCWSPNSEFVDLYINNIYYGLYLLSEKIELSESRLHPEEQPLHLFKFDLKENNSLHFYKLQYVVAVEGVNDIHLFQNDLNRLKNAMLEAPTDTCHHLEQVMDIPSFAYKYLIDQMFSNTDMWWKSHYFYCSGERPFIFYEGPVWDFDLAWRYSTNSFVIEPLSSLLIRNDTFRAQVVKSYETEGRPYLTWLIDSGIDSLASIIQNASQANSIRRRRTFNEDRRSYSWTQPSMPSPDSLKTFLSKRMTFLDKHWILDLPYNPILIQMPLEGGDVIDEFEPGLTIGQYIEQSHSWEDYTSLIWENPASGKLYTADSIVDTIMRLNLYRGNLKQSADVESYKSNTYLTKKEKRNLLYTSIFFLAFMLLIGYTLVDNQKSKKRK